MTNPLDSKNALHVISDFNCDPLTRLLSNTRGIECDVRSAPFGQVIQSLNNAADRSGDDYIVWTQPHGLLPTFSRAYEFFDVDLNDVLNDVEEFSDLILRVAKQHRTVFVVSWTIAGASQGYGMLDWRPGLGVSYTLAKMNAQLAEQLSVARNVFVIDPHDWFLGVQGRPYSPKMWYAAKVPYTGQVFENAARSLSTALSAIKYAAKKIVLLDLDNTLWGGVVGEEGWQGIRLGGHDFVGEAFVDFQKSLLSLTRRGVQLAIVSKNDEATALEAIDLHPEMQLRRKNFAGWRINWNDKAENIVSLLEELGLGQDAAVFIDDNPSERDRIRNALPSVLVPEVPDDPTEYALLLRGLTCFETPSISSEDRNRTAFYVAERRRRETKGIADSFDAWLERLGTVLQISFVNAINLTRVTQLLNKTNQLNLSTRRLSEQEVLDWGASKNRQMFAVSSNDCFGDAGLVGILSIEIDGAKGNVVDYVLSCRVMGRLIEQALLGVGAKKLGDMGAKTMEVRYIHTERNHPTLEVLQKSSLQHVGDNIFVANCSDGLPISPFISILFCDS